MRRGWLLGLALLLAVGGGGAYLWQWLAGLRGADLLGFTAVYVCIPLALALLLIFAYFRK